MDAPSYVQGLYTVAQRDAIFTKANKYPDAANGLQNQVPTIFPDGSIGWRQIPEGGDGTANANIAVIESTQYASRDYAVNDLLIYNGQLYRVSTPIAAGGTITPETNVVSTTVALWALESFVPLVGKGVNLLDNAYFIGGGTAGAFPINQNGNTGSSAYTNAGRTVDRWSNHAATTVGVEADGLVLSATTALFQMLETSRMRLGETYTLSAIVNGVCYSVTFDYAATNTRAGVYCGTAYLSFYGDMWSQTPSKNGVGFDGISDVTKVSAVKLELGSQQTLARQVNGSWVLNDPPPNYQQELAKCQKYLLVLDGSGNAYSYKEYIGSVTTTNQAGFYIPTPVTMSGTPNVSLVGTSPVFSQYYSSPAVSGDVTAIWVNHIFANGLYVLATCPGISSAGIVGLGLKGKIIISAEL